jgi:hypothetical protein
MAAKSRRRADGADRRPPEMLCLCAVTDFPTPFGRDLAGVAPLRPPYALFSAGRIANPFYESSFSSRTPAAVNSRAAVGVKGG